MDQMRNVPTPIFATRKRPRQAMVASPGSQQMPNFNVNSSRQYPARDGYNNQDQTTNHRDDVHSLSYTEKGYSNMQQPYGQLRAPIPSPNRSVRAMTTISQRPCLQANHARTPAMTSSRPPVPKMQSTLSQGPHGVTYQTSSKPAVKVPLPMANNQGLSQRLPNPSPSPQNPLRMPAHGAPPRQQSIQNPGLLPSYPTPTKKNCYASQTTTTSRMSQKAAYPRPPTSHCSGAQPPLPALSSLGATTPWEPAAGNGGHQSHWSATRTTSATLPTNIERVPQKPAPQYNQQVAQAAKTQPTASQPATGGSTWGKAAQEQNSMRLLTATIEGARHWAQYKNKIPLLFEIYGMLASAVSASKGNTSREFLIKNENQSITCVFYQIDRELPRMNRGSWFRCVGNLSSDGTKLQVLSVRPASDAERTHYHTAVIACDKAMRQLMSQRTEM